MKKSRKVRLRRIAERTAKRKALRDGECITGKISMTAGGYGFVVPDDGSGKDEVFVPAKFAGFALDGDTVKVNHTGGHRLTCLYFTIPNEESGEIRKMTFPTTARASTVPKSSLS